jgi:hypothetical protein
MRLRLSTVTVVGTVFLLACAARPQTEPMVGSAGFESPPGLRGGGLDDHLAVQPGVSVSGSGSRARIHVSGADYPNPPLFVVDGVILGYDFSHVHSMVLPNDVDSIRVIRATDPAAARYGMRGGNGVIEIATKRGP